MHLARHTFATELRRVAGNRDQTDLETAMDAYARWLEQQREDEIVPPEADR